MQILFLDESGTIPPIGKKHAKHFVIGGVAIPESHWHEIYKELRVIKRLYKITSEIKWRFFSPHNKDDENGMKHLSFDQKNEVRDKIYKLISSYKSVKVISIVTDVEEAYKLPYINDSDDLYWYSYKQVIERFQYHLQDLSREAGSVFNGIVIIDNRLPCDDNKLRNMHSKLLIVDKENYSRFDNLIEGLFIAPSHLSVGIQLADMATGAIFRKYENNDIRYFNHIKSSIRNRNGIIEGYGVVRFPKK